MTKTAYETIPDSGPVIITKDGRPMHVRLDTPDEAFAFLLKWQGQSVDYALTHGGYAIVQVPTDKWSDLEMRHHYGPRAFSDHGHNMSDRDPLTRENCSACCLLGYFPRGTTADEKAQGPNVANWQRDYVQARRPIPAKWRNAFYSYKDSDNEAWKAALELDIATYGVRFEES